MAYSFQYSIFLFKNYDDFIVINHIKTDLDFLKFHKLGIFLFEKVKIS